jgi:hypothetical protein
MVEEREILHKVVIPSLGPECKKHNVRLAHIDLQWGVASETEFREQIIGRVRRASIFVAILGKRFGAVPEGEYDSVNALEIYSAITTPSLNVIIFRRDPTVSFRSSQDQVATDIEQVKLIRRLKWLQMPIERYGSHKEFTRKASQRILTLLDELYFSKTGILFLSYSRHDHALAERTGSLLRALRFNVWMDSTNIEIAADWPEKLAKGIEESDVVLFLASAQSASSPYCSKEIAHATNHRKPMITLHLDDISLPSKISFLVSDSQHLWLSRYSSLESALVDVSSAAERLIKELT